MAGTLETTQVDSLLGFGLSSLILGGITPFSSARMHLIRLLSPEDPSECPTFGFTEPM